MSCFKNKYKKFGNFERFFKLFYASPVQTFKWTDEDLRKLAGENILRVFREVEKQKKGQTF